MELTKAGTIRKQNQSPKTKLSRRDKKKFAEEYVKSDRNATLAYQRIRPLVSEKSAQVRGHVLLEDVITRVEIQAILDEIGLTKRYILEGYKTAIESGLSRKATNKDALQGLRDLAKLSGMDKEDDLEASERFDLESLSQDELMKRLDAISNQVKELKREGAIEGELIE